MSATPSKIDAEFLQCAPDGTAIQQSHFRCQDGIELRIVEYLPAGLNAQKTPTIIFVAGWLSLVDGWIEVLSELTPQFPLWYVESREKFSSVLPGPCGNHHFDVDSMAADLAALIQQRMTADQPYLLVGSSLGATTILHALSEKLSPSPLAAALIAPNAEFHFPSWAHWLIPMLPLWIYPAFSRFIKWYLRNFRIDVEKEPEQLRKYERTLDLADPDKLKRNALTLLNYELWDRLDGINTEIMLIGGEADTLHGLEDLQRIEQSLTNGHLKTLSSNKETHSHKAGQMIREWFQQLLQGKPA